VAPPNFIGRSNTMQIYRTILASAAALAVLAAGAPAWSQSFQARSEGITIFGRPLPSPQGIYRSNRGTGSQVKVPQPAAATPLTASECRNLGGKVGGLFACKSGKVCQRTDEDGKTHRVCISKS
jgi:hypothetical protein